MNVRTEGSKFCFNRNQKKKKCRPACSLNGVSGMEGHEAKFTYCSFLHQNYHCSHSGHHTASDLEYSCCSYTGIHEGHKSFYL